MVLHSLFTKEQKS